MKWNRGEVEKLSPILDQIHTDLEPLDGKDILVLCSGEGDVVFSLKEKMKKGHVIGIELSDELLKIAKIRAKEKGLEGLVRFQKAEKHRIPFHSDSFDALVSEFIVFPTSDPTEIGQAEMARVLKPGGKMILTDVILTKTLPKERRDAFQSIDLDYLCEGTQGDFQEWMKEADLINVEVIDYTPTVRLAWKQKQKRDISTERQKAYSSLLRDPEFGLGKTIFYIYVQGEKRI